MTKINSRTYCLYLLLVRLPVQEIVLVEVLIDVSSVHLQASESEGKPSRAGGEEGHALTPYNAAPRSYSHGAVGDAV
jgi:hypothetical protein